MKRIVRLLIVSLPFVLAGCSYISAPSFIHTRDRSYLAARSIPPLRIPPGVSSNAFRNYYPVSDRDYPGNKDVSLVPPGLMQK